MRTMTSKPLSAEYSRFPFTTWLGIDQTGAAVHGGLRARPLPAVVADLRAPSEAQFWIQSEAGRPLRLTALLPGTLADLLRTTSGEGTLHARTALIIDCVLGLPGGSRDLWEWFEEAASAPSPAFGRAPAEAFFAKILASGQVRESANGERFPRRRIEALAGANSVFASRPFQKNIQTGTYRIWRELGLGARECQGPWLDLWPFHGPGHRPLAMEGFPSWMWRRVFECPTRDLDALPEAFARVFQQVGIVPVFRRAGKGGPLSVGEAWALLQGDADLCDALVLAAGGMLLHRRGELLDATIRERAPRGEGWIAGVPFSESVGTSLPPG
jgi:hypothetical protein